VSGALSAGVLNLAPCTLALCALLAGCYGAQYRVEVPPKEDHVVEKLHLSEDGWRQRLTGLQFDILRNQRTERPFTGAYWKLKKPGIYRCVACNQPLFPSSSKFDSGTGWPSFRAPIRQSAVDVRDDDSLATLRTEVRCSRCDGHLGHVFDDGSHNRVLRYCINSAALRFEAAR